LGVGGGGREISSTEEQIPLAQIDISYLRIMGNYFHLIQSKIFLQIAGQLEVLLAIPKPAYWMDTKNESDILKTNQLCWAMLSAKHHSLLSSKPTSYTKYIFVIIPPTTPENLFLSKP